MTEMGQQPRDSSAAPTRQRGRRRWPMGVHMRLAMADGCRHAVGDADACKHAVGDANACRHAVGDANGCRLAVYAYMFTYLQICTLIYLHICIFTYSHNYIVM